MQEGINETQETKVGDKLYSKQSHKSVYRSPALCFSAQGEENWNTSQEENYSFSVSGIYISNFLFFYNISSVTFRCDLISKNLTLIPIRMEAN